MNLSVRKGVECAARLIPLGMLERVTQAFFLPVVYHVVSDQKLPHVEHLMAYRNIQAFTNDIEFLLKRYRPLSLAEVIYSVKNQIAIKKPAFHLTFDDGLREISDIVAPILWRKGVPATIFIPTDFLDNKALFYRHKASLILDYKNKKQNMRMNDMIRGQLSDFRLSLDGSDCIDEEILGIEYKDRKILDEIAASLDLDFGEFLKVRRPYLSTQQVRELLRKDFTVGAHSRDHPRYSSIRFEDQLYQTLSSMDEMRDKFALEYAVFAFPFTNRNVSQRLYEKILSSGIDVMFGSGVTDERLPERCVQRLSFESNIQTAARQLSDLQWSNIKKMIRRCSINRRVLGIF